MVDATSLTKTVFEMETKGSILIIAIETKMLFDLSISFCTSKQRF